MFTHSRIIAAFAIALLAGGPILAADKTAVQGTLTGEDGRPFGGAEIRAQRLDPRAKMVVARTRPDGRYYFIGLPPGTYSLTAYVDGVAMSRANVQTRSDGWVKVDFDLRLNAKGADGTDRLQRDVRNNSGSSFSGGRGSGF
jgi:Carboxypeptidase regulatory-like domain